MKLGRWAPGVRPRSVCKRAGDWRCRGPFFHFFGEKAAIVAGLEQGMRPILGQGHRMVRIPTTVDSRLEKIAARNAQYGTEG